jgi:beta-lactamase regulating signal transducer with metallopeptidase domain
MMALPGTHWIAALALALDRILYCLAEGTALALGVSLILRVVPKRNSQTRFVVWFSTLLAIAMLPLLGAAWRPEAISSVSRHALVTIPAAWAGYIILGWAVLAGAGLARVATGLWQIRALRRASPEIDIQVLGQEVQARIKEFRKLRPVSVRVSPRLHAPAAIGFFRPSVILPTWLTEIGAAAELNHAILHELAHLRRRDDWTNLAQKVVKAVLFFHPGVWWIERKLSLDREMACDDAVLAQSASAQVYAQSLARVAEKSLQRRKIALAQMAVDRMRQLSLRVAQILDEGHPHTTRLWKPAVPMVMAMATVCAFSTSRAPNLVRLADQPTKVASQPTPSPVAQTPSATNVISITEGGVREASPRLKTTGVSLIPARYSPPRPVQQKLMQAKRRPAPQPRVQPDAAPVFSAASYWSDPGSPTDQQVGFVVLVVQTQIVSRPQITPAGGQVLQINMWEVRWYVPARQPAKQIPRKT